MIMSVHPAHRRVHDGGWRCVREQGRGVVQCGSAYEAVWATSLCTYRGATGLLA